MSSTHRTASGTVTESPLVLIDVITDDGIAGHGIVFTYTVAALQPTADLIRNLESLLKGEPAAPRDIAQMLARRFRLEAWPAWLSRVLTWHCGTRSRAATIRL